MVKRVTSCSHSKCLTKAGTIILKFQVLTSIQKLLERVLSSLVNGQAEGAIAVSTDFNIANLKVSAISKDLSLQWFNTVGIRLQDIQNTEPFELWTFHARYSNRIQY